jgi:hypothetical protein
MIRRSRTIKPEFFTSADVRSLPVPARLTFIGLLLYVDDYGNESADAALVKAAIWPTDRHVSENVVREHLSLLAERGMVTFYEVEGRSLLRVTNWDKHQRVDRPSRSNIPSDPTREWPVASEGGAGAGTRREGGAEGETGEPSRVDPEASRESPSPFCSHHSPNGTTKPCKACGNARLALKAWELAREDEL